ncbi:hypothetical protein CVT25_000997 [Psilocybe cyanescens]|uniref:Uncharacterized protein n=1 Tax=Psilocybe cyanescens TaxID=93625 RepID=A0A409XMC8_PSICY|nr:hypothetical protein CVT25_000997 [Psilocybe cyanescens]
MNGAIIVYKNESIEKTVSLQIELLRPIRAGVNNTAQIATFAVYVWTAQFGNANAAASYAAAATAETVTLRLAEVPSSSTCRWRSRIIHRR